MPKEQLFAFVPMALMSAWDLSSLGSGNIGLAFMSARNQGWNLLSEQMTNQDKKQSDDMIDQTLLDTGDRWIIGVWVFVALLAVAILPFASRMGEVAQAIASFCGISLR